jgi:hypothetical protein
MQGEVQTGISKHNRTITPADDGGHYKVATAHILLERAHVNTTAVSHTTGNQHNWQPTQANKKAGRQLGSAFLFT